MASWRADHIERVSGEDLVNLATDVGPAPMQVGAILLLDVPRSFDLATAASTMAERIMTVPRLRQRLIRVPFGCGRPIWVDDPTFDPTRHVRVRKATGDLAGDATDAWLLDLGAELLATRLPRDRPLWSATLIDDVAHGRVALVVVFHHVLADGLGGLAVLANLVDGAATVASVAAPRPAPRPTELLLEAWWTRGLAIRHLPAALRRLRAGLAELRGARTGRASHTSLNAPTGPRRRFVTVQADLDAVRDAAHASAATVNDVVLAGVVGALCRLLGARGEEVDRLVISVPVSARRAASATELGNQVGAVPVELVADPDRTQRLAEVARATRIAKQGPRGASSAFLGPAFRLLARLGLFRRFIERQDLVHTFVTNLRGPDDRLSFCDAPIVDIIPIAAVPGNVTVTFAVLSYAGTLTITIIGDPDSCRDLEALRVALQDELRHLMDGVATPEPGLSTQ